MKSWLVVIAWVGCLSVFACPIFSQKATSNYLRVVTNKSYGKVRKHLALSEISRAYKLDGAENVIYDADDRVVIAKLGYTKAQKIAILKEYLSYEAQTDTSDKSYAFSIGYINSNLRNSHDLNFSLQVEALYSLSLMLLQGSVVYINPVLIDRETGRNCNYDTNAVKDVYRIYKQWFKESEKDDFKTLQWPLQNSKYKWLIKEGAPINRVESL